MKNRFWLSADVSCENCKEEKNFTGISTAVTRQLNKFYDNHSECKLKEFYCPNNCGTITLQEGQVCYRCFLTTEVSVTECNRAPQHDGPCNGLPSATCLVFSVESDAQDCKCQYQFCKPCAWEAVTSRGLCEFCYEVCEKARLEAQLRKIFADKPTEEPAEPEKTGELHGFLERLRKWGVMKW
jgi:hypothetical protein